jgi:hypothetical protein
VGCRAQAKDPPDIPKAVKAGPRGGREWLQTILSRFGPITEKATNTTVLDFEKPLVELDNRIKEVCLAVTTCTVGPLSWRRWYRERKGTDIWFAVPLLAAERLRVFPSWLSSDPLRCRVSGCQVRKVAEENGVDVSVSIKELEERARQVLCLALPLALSTW